MNSTELTIQQRILVVRDQRVMLDFELAALYGVETKALNQAVKRNIERFADVVENQDDTILRSQFVTALQAQSRPKRQRIGFVKDNDNESLNL